MHVGTETVTHGNTGGGGRDNGLKRLIVDDALNTVVTSAGCDYMPHNKNISVSQTSSGAIIADVTKVTYTCACVFCFLNDNVMV
jgi:hypothetical protein